MSFERANALGESRVAALAANSRTECVADRARDARARVHVSEWRRQRSRRMGRPMAAFPHQPKRTISKATQFKGPIRSTLPRVLSAAELPLVHPSGSVVGPWQCPRAFVKEADSIGDKIRTELRLASKKKDA
jgi:hypothetical protein